MSGNWDAFYATMSNAELQEWRLAALTDDERAGVETFRASIEQARATAHPERFAHLVESRRAALANGTVARMKDAPRQEVIDAMLAVIDGYRG